MVLQRRGIYEIFPMESGKVWDLAAAVFACCVSHQILAPIAGNKNEIH
jgi:hypothetical protein